MLLQRATRGAPMMATGKVTCFIACMIHPSLPLAPIIIIIIVKLEALALGLVQVGLSTLM
jgi:hypothetical protein